MTAPHGDLRRYRQGCRCDDCRHANAQSAARARVRRYLAGGSLYAPTHGVVRRLRALAALGWTTEELSHRLGRGPNCVKDITRERWTRTTLTFHREVCALYEELCMTLGPSKRARSRAAEKGWLPPLAWDDIDDIDEQPDMGGRDAIVDEVVVMRVLGYELVPATKAERIEIVRRWRAAGRQISDLERFTGWRADRYYQREETAA